MHNLIVFFLQPLPHNVDWVVSSSLSSNSSWSVVRVGKVRLKHSGTYECRPSNSVPDAVNLIVLDGKDFQFEYLVLFACPHLFVHMDEAIK